MYGLPHTTPSRYSSLPARIPFTMKSRLTPNSFRAVTSLRVAPLRFHSSYSAIFRLSDRTPKLSGRPPSLWPSLERPIGRHSYWQMSHWKRFHCRPVEVYLGQQHHGLVSLKQLAMH